MKIGKVSETVLKRSIFKQIHTKRDEVLLGAGVGEDCAAVKLSPGEIFVISTDPITGTVKDVGMLAIQITANDLASAGAEPVGVMLTVLLPEEIEEEDIREMMRQVEEACAHFHIQVMGGHTEVTRAVTPAGDKRHGGGKGPGGPAGIHGGREARSGHSCDQMDRNRGNFDHCKGKGKGAAGAFFAGFCGYGEGL